MEGGERVVPVRERVQFRPEKMQKVGLFDTPRMFCDLYCLEPGQEQKPHRHEGADKIYYVIEGEGTFTVGDREQRCGPETAVFAPSGADHGVRNPGPGRMTLLVFMAPNPNY
jgi:mannose-6-phosphate isomerase-like protein (cupin superfamily)